MFFRKIVAGVVLGVLALLLPFVVSYADSLGDDFETYVLGSINGQGGWTSLGSAGSGCAVYDHAVSSSLGTAGFGAQSLRISNAVTSGCFGDQTFAKPLTDSVGEVGATSDGFSEGVRQRRFEMQFDIASTVPAVQQPGLFVSVSPDRGDGSRMSYLNFQDDIGGIDVTFYDVQGTGDPANFVPQLVANDLDRFSTHTARLVMDVFDGPSNDIVYVYIDGVLVHTGTSWENYYRYDSEASAEQSPRIVKTVIFRTGGTSVPSVAGNGFLFDNLSLSSGPIPAPQPADKNDCKKGGWEEFTDPEFKNQGECVSYFAKQLDE